MVIIFTVTEQVLLKRDGRLLYMTLSFFAFIVSNSLGSDRLICFFDAPFTGCPLHQFEGNRFDRAG